jgi:hypothetical protein
MTSARTIPGLRYQDIEDASPIDLLSMKST